ncbi:MAG: hypothetical protein ABJM06_05820 [Gilvibacter sp.]
MKTKFIAIGLVMAASLVLWLNGRQLVNNMAYEPLPITAEVQKDTLKQHAGKLLLEAKCNVCHSPTSSHDNRLAPPMIAVKTHYIKRDISLDEFSDQIWNFVKEPSREKSKMRGAINRFGVMPYQEFKEEDIRLIADYLYNNSIEEPSWFKEHKKAMQKGQN